MLKSKEQLVKELGCFLVETVGPDDILFRFKFDYRDDYSFYHFNSNRSVVELKSNINSLLICSVKHEWRKLQTDWQSIVNFKLYDRFGSDAIFIKSESPTIRNSWFSCDINLTDSGVRYKDLLEKYKKISNHIVHSYAKDSIAKDIEELQEVFHEIKQMETLFPPKIIG
jgi:hypothetical protein